MTKIYEPVATLIENRAAVDTLRYYNITLLGHFNFVSAKNLQKRIPDMGPKRVADLSRLLEADNIHFASKGDFTPGSPEFQAIERGGKGFLGLTMATSRYVNHSIIAGTVEFMRAWPYVSEQDIAGCMLKLHSTASEIERAMGSAGPKPRGLTHK